jgi:putative FmdB family regulatory protein
MPTYEYRCAACRRRLEAVQKFSDPPLTECPECHAEALRRVFGNVGVVLKGSGFYRTDNRRSGNGSSPTSDNGSSKESKSDTKSDSGSSSGSKSSDSKGSESSSSSSGSSKSDATAKSA